MLRYIYGNDLKSQPALSQSMFQDRAEQFKHRLGWAVDVDENNEERDVYDRLNPLYVIWQGQDGLHGGSMRLLPTTGPTMINEHFSHVMEGRTIANPQIWECTRFCLAPNAAPRVAAALMLGGGEVMRHFAIRHYAGVFDRRMERIYRMIGSTPDILGAQGDGRERISVGLWRFSDAARGRVAIRAGLSPAVSALWFRRSFGNLTSAQTKTTGPTTYQQ